MKDCEVIHGRADSGRIGGSINQHHVTPLQIPIQQTKPPAYFSNPRHPVRVLKLTLVEDLRSLLGLRTGERVRRLVTRTRERKQRSITPTRTPVSSPRYDDGAHAHALVPYPFHSPGSKSGISYWDIDRWRAATIGCSDFTYSSESSVTVSSVTSPSYIYSSRTRASPINNSSRRSTASG